MFGTVLVWGGEGTCDWPSESVNGHAISIDYNTEAQKGACAHGHMAADQMDEMGTCVFETLMLFPALVR